MTYVPPTEIEKQGWLVIRYIEDRMPAEALELIENGASVRANNGYNLDHALQHAVREGYMDIARAILAKGYGVNEVFVHSHSGNSGSCALAVAVQTGRSDLVRFLLDNGADVNQASGGFGDTPLVRWVRSNHHDREIFDMLIAKNPDFSIADKQGYTPVSFAEMMCNHWHGETVIRHIPIRKMLVNALRVQTDKNEAEQKILHEALLKEISRAAVTIVKPVKSQPRIKLPPKFQFAAMG